MKKHKGKLITGLLIVVLVPIWLLFGIFVDREFAVYYIFRKHRPFTELFFYAPLGESDASLESLLPVKQANEKSFDEFVFEGGGYERRIRLFSP